MSKVVQFEVEDKEYVAIFSRYYSNTFDRNITQCTLVTLPERVVCSGATMCHVIDVDKESEGEKNAFRRAVLFYLLLTDKANNLRYTINEIKCLTKIFQKSVEAEKYKIYGKENQMKTRTVKPCGVLYVGEEMWYLIHPYPVTKDSWQGDNTYRFVGVPVAPVAYSNPDKYDYARHIVTNSFAIEYRADMREIEIQVLDDVDVTETELHDDYGEEIYNILEDTDNGI